MIKGFREKMPWPIRSFVKRYFVVREKSRCVENINLQKRFIFIHIPKNAGTSVYNALGMPRSHHHFYKDYESALGEDFAHYYKIAFCRNPWDRFVSLYNYARQEKSYYHDNNNPKRAIYGAHADYPLLKNATLLECAHYLKEGRLKHCSPWNHWYPQVEWLRDNAGNVVKPNFLGRFENLETDFAKLSAQLGLEGSLGHKNKSSSSHYRELVDPEIKKIISDVYAEDIDYFGYTF